MIFDIILMKRANIFNMQKILHKRNNDSATECNCINKKKCSSGADSPHQRFYWFAGEKHLVIASVSTLRDSIFRGDESARTIYI